MVLTGHELTAASSAVAFLAIVSGYFGIRSANRNALNIAREERSTRRQDELNDLRRATYAKFLVSLDALALASVEQEALLSDPKLRGERIVAIKRRTDALTAARNLAAELDLLASGFVITQANESLKSASICDREKESAFAEEINKLRDAMRYDLKDSKATNVIELGRIEHDKIAEPIPGSIGRPNDAAQSVTVETGIHDTSRNITPN